MKNSIIIIILLAIAILSCQKLEDKDIWRELTSQKLNKSLLLVYYPDASSYDNAWSNQTEIGIFKILEKKIYRLTDDNHSDSYVTINPSKTNIFFTSKRPAQGAFAENGTSRIYKLNLENGKISEFDKILKAKFPKVIGKNCYSSNWSNDNKLVFITAYKYPRKKLCLFNTRDSSLSIIDSTNSSFTVIQWSPNNKFIYYEIFDFKNRKVYRDEIIFNITQNTKNKVLFDSTNSYHFKTWLPNSNGLVYQKENEENFIELYYYDLTTREFSLLYKNENILGNFLCFGNNRNELFVNELNENQNKYNLLELDLLTNKVNKLNNKEIYIDEAFYIK